MKNQYKSGSVTGVTGADDVCKRARDSAADLQAILLDLPPGLVLPEPVSNLQGSDFTGNTGNTGNTASKKADSHLGRQAESVTETVTGTGNISDFSARTALISGLLIRLRCEDPPKKSRREAVESVQRQINTLARLCDGYAGYEDDSDPFSAEAVNILQEEMNEITAYGNPYPLGPLTEDPFGMTPPRRWNGRLL